GGGGILTKILAFKWKLPDAPADLSPWDHWRMPAIVEGDWLDLEDGPVLISVEYTVDAARAAEFVDAMHDYERVRRRDGASRWGIYRDMEDGERYVETFIVQSWAEHLRQHARQTAADRELEKLVRSYVREEPKVRHLIYAQPEE